MDEYDDTPECLDRHRGDCEGEVTFHLRPSDWKSFPRCEKHGAARQREYEENARRYPAMAPSDFDPMYAGERWEDD